jgi:hypothetical protein
VSLVIIASTAEMERGQPNIQSDVAIGVIHFQRRPLSDRSLGPIRNRQNQRFSSKTHGPGSGKSLLRYKPRKLGVGRCHSGRSLADAAR